MELNLKYEYNLQTEIERIADTCCGIYSGFFQSKGFFLVETLTRKDSIFVVLPKLNYSSISNYWEQIGSLDDVNVMKLRSGNILFYKMQSLEVKTASEILISKFITKLNSHVCELEKEIDRMFPTLLKNKLTVTIRPTMYGTRGTFSKILKTKNQMNIDFLYLRLDSDFHTLLSLITSSIIMYLKNCDWHDEFWHERQAISDFLSKTNKRDSGLGLVDRLRKGCILKEEEWMESCKYYEYLGFPVRNAVEVSNGLVYLNGILIPSITETECKIIRNMLGKSNATLFYDEIGDILWGNSEKEFSLWAIAKLMQRIRKKFQSISNNAKIIRNVRGKGYILMG